MSERIFVPFPINRQIGKIRETARKLLDKSTDRHAAAYRRQVSEALDARLAKLGVSEKDRGREIERFWRAVEVETGLEGPADNEGRPHGGNAA
jgi:hypothetical protein